MVDKELTKALLKAKDFIRIKGAMCSMSYDRDVDGIIKLHVDFYIIDPSCAESTTNFLYKVYQGSLDTATKESELWILKIQ